MTTVDEYLQAQRAEWGKYVATEPIDIGGVRAFNTGDPVPVSHVEAGTVPAYQVQEVAADGPEQVVDPTPSVAPPAAADNTPTDLAPAEGDPATMKPRSSRKGN